MSAASTWKTHPAEDARHDEDEEEDDDDDFLSGFTAASSSGASSDGGISGGGSGSSGDDGLPGEGSDAGEPGDWGSMSTSCRAMTILLVKYLDRPKLKANQIYNKNSRPGGEGEPRIRDGRSRMQPFRLKRGHCRPVPIRDAA
jgi:hypothetical protein